MRGVRDPRAFLLTIAHRIFLDLLRRTRTRNHYHSAYEAERPESREADPDARTIQEALQGALRGLPPDQRAVVHLKLWTGLTFEAIAGVLGIPLNTAASRYRYGLDKIRSRLRPLYEELSRDNRPANQP
jgi:RNA polymerase sigma-70 factor (ECF subfamily)